jgi:hypothetical protein
MFMLGAEPPAPRGVQRGVPLCPPEARCLPLTLRGEGGCSCWGRSPSPGDYCAVDTGGRVRSVSRTTTTGFPHPAQS